jgi:hypothetical protein
MPWPNAKSFKKHNKRATPQMARMASAILAKTGDEGKAIRIANAKGKKSRKRVNVGMAAMMK